MSYIIRKTNGTTLGTILDGTVDTAHTSLTLVGRNYANYGQIMTDNLVRLLENSAYNISPSNPLAGQLWWNTGDARLRVYTGSEFKIISGVTVAAAGPITTIAGDVWFDSVDEQLYVYNGTTPYNAAGWILIGPPWKKTKGKSGALWETISDGSVDHDVVSLYLDGARTSIISRDSDFTPVPAIYGFSRVRTGLTSNTSIATGQFWITANNANYLGEQPAANYLRSDIDDITYGNLLIAKNGGLAIGLNSNLQIATTTDSEVSVKNTISNGNISIYANISGTSTSALTIDGATGRSTLKTATLSDTTTSTSETTGALIVAGGAGIAENLYVGGISNLAGVATTLTAPYLTANTMIATTEFVINNSGFLKNKIYSGGNAVVANTFMEVVDTGAGYANLAIDGVSVLTASASGVSLKNGATAWTQPTTKGNVATVTGDGKVATTLYVRQVAQYWNGSAKFVSANPPDPGVNDIGSENGDFWFQYIA
jgi:hypothetical protein